MTISVEDAQAAFNEAYKRKIAAKEKWRAAEDIAEVSPTRNNLREATARYHDHHTANIQLHDAEDNLRAARRLAALR